MAFPIPTAVPVPITAAVSIPVPVPITAAVSIPIPVSVATAVAITVAVPITVAVSIATAVAASITLAAIATSISLARVVPSAVALARVVPAAFAASTALAGIGPPGAVRNRDGCVLDLGWNAGGIFHIVANVGDVMAEAAVLHAQYPADGIVDAAAQPDAPGPSGPIRTGCSRVPVVSSQAGSSGNDRSAATYAVPSDAR